MVCLCGALCIQLFTSADSEWLHNAASSLVSITYVSQLPFLGLQSASGLESDVCGTIPSKISIVVLVFTFLAFLV